MHEIKAKNLRDEAIRAVEIVRVMAMDTGTVGQVVKLDTAVSYMYCDKCVVLDVYGNKTAEYLMSMAIDSGYNAEDMEIYNGVFLIRENKPSIVLSDGTKFGMLVSVTDNDFVRHSVAVQDDMAFIVEGNLEAFLEVCVEITQAW